MKLNIQTIVRICLFLIILGISLHIENQEIPSEPEIATHITVTHYNCDNEGFLNAKTYSMGEVSTCTMAPQDIKIAHAKVVLYQKTYLRKVEAVRCTVDHSMIAFHCGQYSHSSIHRGQATITKKIYLTADQCKQAAKIGTVPIYFSGKNHNIKMGNESYLTSVHTTGRSSEDDDNIDCDGYGMVYKHTFNTHMKRMNLTYNIETGKIQSYLNLELPCKYDTGGCETTDLDGGAYTWNTENACIFVKVKQFIGKMIKYNNQYFITSDDKFDADSDLKFEVFLEKETACFQKTIGLHKTNFESLYVNFEDGFNMANGINLKPANTTQYVTIGTEIDGTRSIEELSDIYDNSENLYKNMADTSRPFEITDLNYDLHSTMKIDFAIHRTTAILRNSEIELLKRNCEIQRTQLLTILMLAQQNDKLAGFLLTGKRNNFLQTVDHGSTAWLYECQEERSPLRILQKCYDKIPIDFMGDLKFVDPISRQTVEPDEAIEISCGNGLENLFHMNLAESDTWYTLEPDPRHHKVPYTFKPDQIHQITEFDQYSTSRAGLYSQKQVKEFWERIVSQRQGDNLLKKFTTNMVDGNPSPSRSRSPWNKYNPGNIDKPNIPIYIDNLISPMFFKNAFISTFGKFAYAFTLAGSWFAAIMLLQYLYKLIVSIFRAFSIHTMVGDSIHGLRQISDALFNTLLVPAQQEQLLRSNIKTVDENNNQPLVNNHKRLYPEIPLPTLTSSINSEKEHNENSKEF